MALLSKRTIFKGEAVPFVMELPNYRMPGIQNVAHLLWDKAKDFLQRAFTVIFLATIVVWFLQTFDFQLNVVADSQNSILAVIAGAISPLFVPLGWIYGQGKCGLHAVGSVWQYGTAPGGTDTAGRGFSLGLLSTVHALYSGHCFHSTGARWKMGGRSGGWTMCDCVGLCTPGAGTGIGDGDDRMNLASVLILALVLLASVLAVRVLWTRRGSCHGCGGFCGSCWKNKTDDVQDNKRSV